MSKMLELVKQVNNQPLDVAGNTMQPDAIEVIPAPRLELQSGSLNDLRSILCELAKNSKLERCEAIKLLKSFYYR